jgi:orotate phosphoribosyltransferase
MNYNDMWARLRVDLLRSVVSKGPVTLRSGKVSDFYIDCRPALLSPFFLYQIAHLVAEKCKDENRYVAGMGVGGAILVSATILANKTYDFDAIFVRDAVKEHGLKKQIEYPLHFTKDLSISIIDDVLTTGSSVKACIDALQKDGCNVSQVVVLVDREEGGKEELEKRYNIPVVSIFTKSDLL